MDNAEELLRAYVKADTERRRFPEKQRAAAEAEAALEGVNVNALEWAKLRLRIVWRDSWTGIRPLGLSAGVIDKGLAELQREIRSGEWRAFDAGEWRKFLEPLTVRRKKWGKAVLERFTPEPSEGLAAVLRRYMKRQRTPAAPPAEAPAAPTSNPPNPGGIGDSIHADLWAVASKQADWFTPKDLRSKLPRGLTIGESTVRKWLGSMVATKYIASNGKACRARQYKVKRKA